MSDQEASPDPPPIRPLGAASGGQSCLHCVIVRVLRVESEHLAARGVEVTLRRSEPVWLPRSGASVYRRLRRFLASALEVAATGSIKLSVIDLPGKSHVEVTATLVSAAGPRVLASAFPRHAPGTLARGFGWL